MQISLVGRIGRAHLPADHQQVQSTPQGWPKGQLVEGTNESLSAFGGVEKTKVGQKKIVGRKAIAGTPPKSVISSRWPDGNVAADGNE